MDKMEAYTLMRLYAKKLDTYLYKHTSVSIYQGDKSYYSPEKGEIYLSHTARDFEKYHELGHDIWHSLGNPRVPYKELLDYYVGFCEQDTIKEIVNFLDYVSLEYKADMNGVTPLSDFLFGFWNLDPICYRGHEKGYYNKFIHQNQFGNELFANICGIIGENNVNGFYAMLETIPKCVYMILDALDKCVHL